VTARLTLEVQAAAPAAALRRLSRFGQGPLQLALRDVGEAWLLMHQTRFDREQSPDGTPWAPLSPRYKRRKDARRPGMRTLVYDNHLRGLMRYDLEGDDALVFGTNRPYGALHQFGGTAGMARGAAAIPARPWLGLSAADDEETLAIIEAHLVRSIGGPDGDPA
jgi:phage virion morphogenesis protein